MRREFFCLVTLFVCAACEGASARVLLANNTGMTGTLRSWGAGLGNAADLDFLPLRPRDKPTLHSTLAHITLMLRDKLVSVKFSTFRQPAAQPTRVAVPSRLLR